VRPRYSMVAAIAIVAALVAGLLGCSDEAKRLTAPTEIAGSGVLAEESRELDDFAYVVSDIVGNVSVRQSSSCRVRFRVDDNLVEYLETTVVGNVLEIGIRDGVSIQATNLDIAVYCSNLQGITMNGVGNLSVHQSGEIEEFDLVYSGVGNAYVQLTTERLNSTFTGVGNISVAGTARYHDVTMSAVGNLAASSLATDTTSITMTGEGATYVRVEDHLKVLLAGIGNVTYVGHPSIDATITGIGSIIDGN